MKKIVFLSFSSEKKSIWDVLKLQNYGILVLAQILRDRGHAVEIIDYQNINWKKVLVADFVCFSFYSCASNLAYKTSKELTERCKNSGLKLPVRIMGGVHPSYCAEESLHFCDYVIRGEGEISLPLLINEISGINSNLETINGLSYVKDGRVIHNKVAAPINDSKVLQTAPARDLDPCKRKWNRTPVFTPCRGCPYDCSFCSQMFGKKMRLSDPEWTVSELKKIITGKYFNLSRAVFIGSDNFTANKKWAKEVLSLMRKEDMAGKIGLHIQCRTDIASDEELLELMKPFVTRAYIGTESFDNATLARMNKGIVAEKMIAELRVIIKAGILTHCHFIFGTDFDEPGSVMKTVRLAREIGVYGISLFGANPFPGTKFREEMSAQGRIITSDWRYYNLQHVLVAPLLGKPSSFQREIENGYRHFYTLENAQKYFEEKGIIGGFYGAMLWHSFRKRDRNMEEHIEFLKRWENNKYDSQDKFILAS